MVGPVLDEIRFPFNLEGETSASITSRTNLSVNTVDTKLVTINNYHQNNIDIKFHSNCIIYRYNCIVISFDRCGFCWDIPEYDQNNYFL